MSEVSEILAEYAEGFLDGSVTVDGLITKYDISPESELYHLLQMARDLEESLVMVEPSAKFIRKLRKELTNEESDALRWLLHAPALRVAAGIGGITVAAGIVWYARRVGLEVKLPRDMISGLTGKSDSSSVMVS